MFTQVETLPECNKRRVGCSGSNCRTSWNNFIQTGVFVKFKWIVTGKLREYLKVNKMLLDEMGQECCRHSSWSMRKLPLNWCHRNCHLCTGGSSPACPNCVPNCSWWSSMAAASWTSGRRLRIRIQRGGLRDWFFWESRTTWRDVKFPSSKIASQRRSSRWKWVRFAPATGLFVFRSEGERRMSQCPLWRESGCTRILRTGSRHKGSPFPSRVLPCLWPTGTRWSCTRRRIRHPSCRSRRVLVRKVKWAAPFVFCTVLRCSLSHWRPSRIRKSPGP